MTRTYPARFVAFVLAAAAACSSASDRTDTPSSTGGAPASTVDAAKPTGTIVKVEMFSDEKGNYFSPATIDARRGDVVRFTLVTGVHNVSFPHDSNSIKAGLPASSELLQIPGQTWDLPINLAAGSYYFHCDPHAALGMKGKLNVQ